MAGENFEALRQVVVGASETDRWDTAVLEWRVIDLREDAAGEGVCVCGQQNLVKLFTIRNSRNGRELFPIGSRCINHFGQQDLDRDVSLLGDLLTLRAALQDGALVTLTGEYFSRAMLEYFYDNDVFFADAWNGGDSEQEYLFMLKMFNKHDKDAITKPQRRKVSVLLRRKIEPFVLQDPRLQ
ncbi:hypothetical protein BIV03_00995 [Curtobacterium sp. MCBA15_016]|uniref:hypothetical protein n=1 Tax=Curtobacterium sp. MCBA15_016 TaxID=1898740 RepID=UPI0008DD7439|nr:hypothetical protein [Curtobacterium sp. MCBA15_016]OII28860.1 hypothetical protein BIV03_00995 [Curtobacterium sp. MCBA15_016]